jgi:hypothetical protein
MNAKRCKSLRRMAELKTVGLPVRGYRVNSRAKGSTILNDPRTTRGYYRALKTAVRKFKRAEV